MTLTSPESLAIASCISAVFMAGSSHIRVNLLLFAVQSILIAAATAVTAVNFSESPLYLSAVATALINGIFIPAFLIWIIKKVEIHSDTGATVPAPLLMQLCLCLIGFSYWFTGNLPLLSDGSGHLGATAAVSLVMTGLILMLTRKVAVSQIVGFLVIENGISLFALTQTMGMPLIVETGILLNVLVAVMICGLLVFRIQKSFEHIDVTMLSELRD